MLVIRFTRIGKKNQPSYRIVVVDKRKSSCAGDCVEILGTYNPFTKKKTLKNARIKYWISKGAQPSVSIHNLLIREKVIEGKKIATHVKSKKKEGVAAAPTAPAPIAPVVEATITPIAPVTPAVETPKEEPKKEEKKEEAKPEVVVEKKEESKKEEVKAKEEAKSTPGVGGTSVDGTPGVPQ
ncbi:30S ribosomal protein S16 [Patescibacteria group bacterium]|nr:30S ribosomal protein S16 [Patescibacteria group bacterium]